MAALLDRAGLEPACLELELTEGVVAEQAMTTLAHSIDMRVVADGIETTEQLDLARSGVTRPRGT